MINSLSKDSHITRAKRPLHSHPSESHPSERGVYKSEFKIAAPNRDVKNPDIFINKPAEISFSGFSCPKDLESLKNHALIKIVNASKAFLKKEGKINSSDLKTLNKESKTLIESAVDFLQNPGKTINESVKKFLGENETNENFTTLFKDAQEIIVDDKNKNVPIDYNSSEYKDSVKKFIGEAVDIRHYADERHDYLMGKRLKNFLIKADRSQAVFTALFAAGLACFLRPITIIGLPGGKKNKKDKIYAASHSIASGAIGYIVALIISSPIAMAIDKIANNPDKFLGTGGIKYLNKKIQTKYNMEGIADVVKEDFGSSNRFGTSRKYLNMVPEIITAVPKAVITIALIPPILKYMFGIEKKVPVTAQNVLTPTQNYAAINFQSSHASKKTVFQSFMGGK